ncbi:hypothetical protein jhhlp_004838 [Lomentospora prolificans]|uniref:Tc1-like transposase DDE domain-containing protein n=1 Tax=Lomentospora prolificans TaxID=41688 RepID=A0A2N3N7P9_9PEZI|nr:hypothetical protein jhhlp_004838 [Lomentospora prolificans]
MPSNRTGPDPKITPSMQMALCRQLAEDPDMDRREMADFIRDKFSVDVPLKVMRRVAEQQRPELRHFYQYRLKSLGCKSYHLVFIDESGIDKPGVFRRKGWAPKGITPVHKARFQREGRLQILAAYTQKGVKLSRLFFGTVDKSTFEDFIDQLLRHCGIWPEPETVLIMDNVAFHHSERVRQMCEDAGVKVDFQAPYTPRTNPVKEFFGEIKAHAKAKRRSHQTLAQRDFERYIKACVKAVGNRRGSAEGHFRRAGIYIEQPPEKLP